MTTSDQLTHHLDGVDPVFLGLTRPAMFWGVTHSFFVINLIVCLIGFLAAHSWLAVLLAIPIHGLGYLACLSDARVFDLAYVRASKCSRCTNRRFWGATSYDLA
jgi:type IV secretion system protein VirB3